MNKVIFHLLMLAAIPAILPACGDIKSPQPKQNIARPVVDEESIIKDISRLIDVIYDQPDSCLQNPDSFLNSVRALPRTEGGREMYLYLLLNTAYLLREHGSVLSSIRYYEQGLAYYKEYKLYDIDFYDYIAKSLGSLYTITGDFEKAAILQNLAIVRAYEEKRIDILPALYGNQAITFYQMGWYDSVLVVCRRGLAETGRTDIVRARLYNEMAKSYLLMKQYDSAVHYNSEAVSLFAGESRGGDTAIWFAASLVLQSEIAKKRGNWSLAFQSATKAVTLTEQQYPGSHNREKAKFYAQRGGLLFEKRLMDSALADFVQVSNLLGHAEGFLFADNTITDALLGRARCYWEKNWVDSACFFYVRAIENDYLVQQSIVSKESNYLNSRNNRELVKEALNRLWQLYTIMPSKDKGSLAIQMLWCMELSKGRQLLMEIDRTGYWLQDTNQATLQNARKDLRYLWGALSEESDSVKRHALEMEAQRIAFEFNLSERYFERAFRSPDYDSFRTGLQKLTQDRDVVGWLINEQGGSFTVTIGKKGVEAYRLPDSSLADADIRGFCHTYFNDGPEAFNNNPATYYRKAEGILQVLIPGYSALAQKNMLFSPDGILYNLPLDALCEKDRFLAENKNTSYTYTLLLNVFSGQRETYHTDIRFFSRSNHDGHLVDLQYVSAERASVANRYKSILYEDGLACDSNFLSAMNTTSVLHVATHAIADSNAEPYIVLSDKITLNKISYTTALCPLVVLSACGTASGKLLTAEGMESLNRAFLSKGIKGVIASQWQVNDQAMAEIVGRFYDELFKVGLPDVALAAAKRLYIDQGHNARSRNPWYWASLHYTGVPVKVVTEKKTSYWYWLWAGCIVAAIFGGYRLLNNRGNASLF